MEIRGAAMPDEPGPGQRRRGDASGGDASGGDAWQGGPEAPVDSVSYRVDRRFFAVKVAGAVVFALVAIGFHTDRITVAFAGIAALVTAAYAARDAIAPVRLAADREGVTVVAGYAGHHRLAWDEIERVRLDRRRHGARSAMLEIDAGERLYLLSTYDLSAHPREALDALTRLRPTR